MRSVALLLIGIRLVFAETSTVPGETSDVLTGEDLTHEENVTHSFKEEDAVTTYGPETTEFTLNITETSTGSGKASGALTEENLRRRHEEDLRRRHEEDLRRRHEEDFFNIRCVNVAGNVGEKLTLTCRVSYQRNRCCIWMYKFIQTASSDDPTICREEFRSDSCEQLASFSCPYTAKVAMTTKFQFIVQETCGYGTTVFNVIVTGNTSDVLNEKRHGEKRVIDSFKAEVLLGCVVTHTIIVAIIGLIVWIKYRQVKNHHATGYVKGSTTKTDSVSDEKMLIYTVFPLGFFPAVAAGGAHDDYKCTFFFM